MATPPFKVKALYEYTSSHEDDLPFDVGQIITVTDVEDDDWYGGEYNDASGSKQEGIFPRNFVEKFEPTAPPRPARRKKDSDPSPTEPEPVPAPEPAVEPAPASPPPPPTAEPASPPPPPVPTFQPSEPESVPAPAPAPAQEPAPIPAQVAAPVPAAAPQAASLPPRAPSISKPAPPPVSEKPSGNSFKDRIAAFNKPAAPPVTPFKPGNLGSGGSNFIKKPFVAPPPSRNAFVPPPQQAPTAKVYRREEDPEIREREAESMENAEKAGLVPGTASQEGDDDQPKPTSLKDRIALLQKQQAEQAQRHAEAAAKKTKRPPPPPKKREDTQQPQPPATPAVDESEGPAPPLERQDTAELAASRKSTESTRGSTDESQPPRQPMPIRRKSTRDTVENDGNEADMSGAGDTTEGQEDLAEKEDSDAQPRPVPAPPGGSAPAPAAEQVPEGGEDEVEDDDEDPEARRKEELRARMAKMSGGMGMYGMFGAGMPPPAPPKKKKSNPTSDSRALERAEESTPTPVAAPPVPTPMALPGMGKQRQVEDEAEVDDADATGADITPVVTATSQEAPPQPTPPVPGNAPPVPGARPAPPPVPSGSRPPPPPPPGGMLSAGSETDDELSENPQKPEAVEASAASRAPPPIPAAASPPLPTSPRSSIDQTTSHGPNTPVSPQMPPQAPKRNSRPPPPIPGGAPPLPTQSRPPPPPPPGALSRTSTADQRLAQPMQPGALDNGEEGEVTEYEGDYDTDIGSSVPHKDALKAHQRDSSIDENASIRSPVAEAPPSLPPPIPSAGAPRGPPPVPAQAPPARQSMDAPRAVPPPPPPANPTPQAYDDDYDPFNYNAPNTPSAAAPPPPGAFNVLHEEPFPVTDAPAPIQSPPPPRAAPAPPPPARTPSHRQSLDVSRQAAARRSVDAPRASISQETGFMANDIDLAEHTKWWMSPNSLPPILQGRKDLLSETTESTASAPGGRTQVTKEIAVLFQDYSQTTITVVYDPQDPSNSETDQRHEPPPRNLRQDQLEQAYETFGRQLAGTITGKKDTIIGDGSPHALVHELLKPLKDALGPVGTRSYGALVYANLANASTQMNDEIRPGDIVSIRNAKFQGKHGAMHQKYTAEVGKPDHVGIVAEWDGTKKKVRAWEQGRESKKCKQESFRLEDLRSGEVKIWRVMPRSWVGWGPARD